MSIDARCAKMPRDTISPIGPRVKSKGAGMGPAVTRLTDLIFPTNAMRVSVRFSSAVPLRLRGAFVPGRDRCSGEHPEMVPA